MAADELTPVTVTVMLNLRDIVERTVLLVREELAKPPGELNPTSSSDLASDQASPPMDETPERDPSIVQLADHRRSHGAAPSGNHAQPGADHKELAPTPGETSVADMSAGQLTDHLRTGHGHGHPPLPGTSAGELHQFLHEIHRELTHSHGGVDGYQAVSYPWEPGDEAIAAEVMSSSVSPHVEAAWRAFAATSRQNRLTGPQLDAAVGLEGRRRNGALSRMSASCRVRGRVGAWEWDPSTNTYWMEPLQAELFRRPLGQAQA
jgi:hypothetical protein